MNENIVNQLIATHARENSLAGYYIMTVYMRSCEIQYLSTPDDIEQMTRYAARAVSELYELYPDDYLLIAPLCRTALPRVRRAGS